MLQTDLHCLPIALLPHHQFALLGIDLYRQLLTRFEAQGALDVVGECVVVGVEKSVGGDREQPMVSVAF